MAPAKQQVSVWRITLETVRTWDGVLVPAHQRYREERLIETSPFTTRKNVISKVPVHKTQRIHNVEHIFERMVSA